MAPARDVRKTEKGQGLVEYTLIVFFVTLVVWLGVKNTDVGARLADNWSKIVSCVGSPFSCSAD
ncbi:MAG TPA: hypothetical protein VNN77_12925 [candidate division Zixibacteria bacterium]|nr:hypothetical protein [candidate division Zixibacteria bacterium]